MSLYPSETSIQIGGKTVNYPGLVDGKFSDGDPSNPAVVASHLPAEHINLLTDLIANVMIASKTETNNTDAKQLADAIKSLIAEGRDALITILDNHSAKTNPHNTSKEDVGLGLLPNKIGTGQASDDEALATIAAVKSMAPKKGVSLEMVKNEVKIQLQNEKKKLVDEALNKAVPVGYLFLQLPYQKSPKELYPSSWKWNNISNQYAGCFFRVEGGSAGGFAAGKQEYALPEVVGHFGKVQADRYRNMSYTGPFERYWDGSVGTDSGKAKDYGISVGFRLSKMIGSNHVTSAAHPEVRPDNHTIRIWERVA